MVMKKIFILGCCALFIGLRILTGLLCLREKIDSTPFLEKGGRSIPLAHRWGSSKDEIQRRKEPLRLARLNWRGSCPLMAV